jgi:hypothetical protein
MPQLTRRRQPDVHQQCWHIYYGDVHVGTIILFGGIAYVTLQKNSGFGVSETT